MKLEGSYVVYYILYVKKYIIGVLEKLQKWRLYREYSAIAGEVR